MSDEMEYLSQNDWLLLPELYPSTWTKSDDARVMDHGRQDSADVISNANGYVHFLLG
jgi:hypothetical protein